MEKVEVEDKLGISTIGNSRRRQDFYNNNDDDKDNNKLLSIQKKSLTENEVTHVHLPSNVDRIVAATERVLKYIDDDSRFFDFNAPVPMPSFETNEVTLSEKKLGMGEFGIVFAVESFHDIQNNAKSIVGERKMECDNDKETPTRTIKDKDYHSIEQPMKYNPIQSSSSHHSISCLKKQKTPEKHKPLSQDHRNSSKVSFSEDVLSKSGSVLHVVSHQHLQQEQQPSNKIPFSSHHVETKIQVEVGSSQPFLHQYIDNGVDRYHDNDDSTLSTEDDDDDDRASMIFLRNGDSCGMKYDNEEEDEEDGELSYLRSYMTSHCFRRGLPRYAMKRLRPDLVEHHLYPQQQKQQKQQHNCQSNTNLQSGLYSQNNDTRNSWNNEKEYEITLEAVIDLAVEAKFLASIQHPNIVKMRTTIGKPGRLDFGIVMDYLVITLRDKMVQEWNFKRQYDPHSSKYPPHHHHHHQYHSPTSNKPINFLLKLLDKMKLIKHERDHPDVHVEKILAAYDIARAMKYLHNSSIIFRDLKPENLAYDVRGNLRLFDFGLAKELLQKDKVRHGINNVDDDDDDAYHSTGMTGSRRYMAPEVISCKDYGRKADVYSFAILVWEIFSSQQAFCHWSMGEHFEQVVVKKKRPSKHLSSQRFPSFNHHKSSSSSNNNKSSSSSPPNNAKRSYQWLWHMLENAWRDRPIERLHFWEICNQLSLELHDWNDIRQKVGIGGGGGSTSNRSHVSDRTTFLLNQSIRSRCDSATTSGG